LLPVANSTSKGERALELRHRGVELSQDEQDAAELFMNARQLAIARRRPGAAGDLKRLRIVPAGLRAGKRVGGAITGEDAVSERFVPLLTLDEVVRQLLVMVGEAIRIQLFDRATDRSVELLAALDEQALVGDVLDDRVLEDVGRFGSGKRLCS
jgi:hypothetical protein